MSELRKIKLPAFEGKEGFAYAGRCAGGPGALFGGQYLIIAATDEVLQAVWDVLEGTPLDMTRVYDAAAIKPARVEAMVEVADFVHSGRNE